MPLRFARSGISKPQTGPNVATKAHTNKELCPGVTVHMNTTEVHIRLAGIDPGESTGVVLVDALLEAVKGTMSIKVGGTALYREGVKGLVEPLTPLRPHVQTVELGTSRPTFHQPPLPLNLIAQGAQAVLVERTDASGAKTLNLVDPQFWQGVHVVVVEQFILRKDAHPAPSLVAARVQGAVELLAHMYAGDVVLVLQQASTASEAWPNHRIRKHFPRAYEVCAYSPHVVDALRHVLTYLERITS